MKRTTIALLVATVLGATGCMSRTLLDVQDAVDGNTTILTTLDVKNYVFLAQAKYVFWECSDNDGSLTCTKRCDVRDDEGDKVICQKFFIGVQ